MPKTVHDVMTLGETMTAAAMRALHAAREGRDAATKLGDLLDQRGRPGFELPEGSPVNFNMVRDQPEDVAEKLRGAVGELEQAAEDAGFLLRSLEAAQAAAEAVGERP